MERQETAAGECTLLIRADDDALAAKVRAALREAQVPFRETEAGRFEARGPREAIGRLLRHAGLWMSTADLERCQGAMLVEGASPPPETEGLPRMRDVLARWWATGLADALDPSRLRFRFQPVVKLAAPGTLLGFEALIALQPATASLPPVPERLLDAAARACLLRELDEASLESALREGCRLPGDALVFVNCMPETVRDEALPDALLRSCREHGRDPRSVVMEINLAQAIRSDAVALTRSLRALRAAGAQIALDRLDSDPSALELIGALAPDYLKVDRALVHQVHSDPIKQARLAPLLAACRQSGATPIAVGIEDGAEESWLERQGVTWGQGFLFGLPEEPV